MEPSKQSSCCFCVLNEEKGEREVARNLNTSPVQKEENTGQISNTMKEKKKIEKGRDSFVDKCPWWKKQYKTASAKMFDIDKASKQLSGM